ncbi:MAG: hypothetical protein KatS3mg068_1578 [Candidatus Sericytochromatia bacterium]|nr:MAG: hypothetical protein KatS3mg068_1578 [Candidatus Sericytochromatia bacterium]
MSDLEKDKESLLSAKKSDEDKKVVSSQKESVKSKENRLTKVVVNKNLKFEFGGIRYEMKKNEVYEVPEELKELLKKAGHLAVV